MADRVAGGKERGKVEALGGTTSAQVAEWLRKLVEYRKDMETGQRVVNAKQHEMVKQVAERAMQELGGEAGGGAVMGEPL
eukprot:8195200-Pyramimonas_sp.AAC.1